MVRIVGQTWCYPSKHDCKGSDHATHLTNPITVSYTHRLIGLVFARGSSEIEADKIASDLFKMKLIELNNKYMEVVNEIELLIKNL